MLFIIITRFLMAEHRAVTGHSGCTSRYVGRFFGKTRHVAPACAHTSARLFRDPSGAIRAGTKRPRWDRWSEPSCARGGLNDRSRNRHPRHSAERMKMTERRDRARSRSVNYRRSPRIADNE